MKNTKIFSLVSRRILALIFFSMSYACSLEAWSDPIRFDFDTLPEPPWFQFCGPTSTASVSGGVMTIDSSGYLCQYSQDGGIGPWPTQVDSNLGWIVEARLKVGAGSDGNCQPVGISAGDGVAGLTIRLDPNTLCVGGAVIPMNTTDNFHVYRIEAAGIWYNRRTKVYVDNQIVYDASGYSPFYSRTLEFGAQTPTRSISEWDYLWFDTAPKGWGPVVQNVAFSSISNEIVTWYPRASDPVVGPLGLVCRLGTVPAHGTASIAANCTSASYQSVAGYVGADSFTYIASDGREDSNIGTVSVQVTEPPIQVPAALPNGTLLAIERGEGSGANTRCASGSCFSLEIVPGQVIWVDIGPGNNRGIVIGKDQKSGDQEQFCRYCSVSGELTNAWYFGGWGAFATVLTAPYTEFPFNTNAAANRFWNTSCAGIAGCAGLTELNTWHMAWGGTAMALGSAAPCTHANCSAQQKTYGKGVTNWTVTPAGAYGPTGDLYVLDYAWVVPSGLFQGMKFGLHLAGTMNPPLIYGNSASAGDGSLSVWVDPPEALKFWSPQISSTRASDKQTCTLVSPMTTSRVILNADCSGGALLNSNRSYFNDAFTYQFCDQESCDTGTISVYSSSNHSSAVIVGWDAMLDATANTPAAWQTNLFWRRDLYPTIIQPQYTVTEVLNGIVTTLPTASGTIYNGATPGSYTPNYGYVGPDHILFQFSDGATGFVKGNGKVAITVHPAAPIPIPPTTRNSSIKVFTGEQTTWQPLVFDPDKGPSPPTCRLGTGPRFGTVIIPADCSAATYQSNAGFVGTETVTVIANDGVSDSLPATVTITVSLRPAITVKPVSVSGVSGAVIGWQPAVTTNIPNATITCIMTWVSAMQPSNGIATVADDCSASTYQSRIGFIGIDSFEIYVTMKVDQVVVAADYGKVTIAVTEPLPDSACVARYPVSDFSQTGKEGTITISFAGNVVSNTNKEIKICPGTTLKYNAISTQGAVICRVKNNTTRHSGTLRIGDHLKCTDKPEGKDKIVFKVKSGMT